MNIIKLARTLSELSASAPNDEAPERLAAVDHIRRRIRQRGTGNTLQRQEIQFIQYLAQKCWDLAPSEPSLCQLNATILGVFIAHTNMTKANTLIYDKSEFDTVNTIKKFSKRSGRVIEFGLKAGKKRRMRLSNRVSGLIICTAKPELGPELLDLVKRNILPVMHPDYFDLLVAAPDPTTAANLSSAIYDRAGSVQITFPTMGDGSDIGGLCLRCAS